MDQKLLPIVEMYPCLQFEGSKVGVPHLLIRTTGCTHRCFFGEKGGWCDSPYTSITPEKGKFSMDDVVSFVKSYPHIKHLMITGGSPTMHPKLVNDLINLVKDFNYGYFVTLETEGSHDIHTDYPIDLISLSPKFFNSVPILGTTIPSTERVVDQKFIDQHNKFRLNYKVMRSLISNHIDFQLKPVIDPYNTQHYHEVEECIRELRVPPSKVWVMPAGHTREELIQAYPPVIEYCIEKGYNFTGRDHIIAYDQKRGV